MKQEGGRKESAREQSKGHRQGENEERERGWIKVGGARPSHFLRLKITTILLLLHRNPQGTRLPLYSLMRYKSESHALGLNTMVPLLPSVAQPGLWHSWAHSSNRSRIIVGTISQAMCWKIGSKSIYINGYLAVNKKQITVFITCQALVSGLILLLTS